MLAQRGMDSNACDAEVMEVECVEFGGVPFIIRGGVPCATVEDAGSQVASSSVHDLHADRVALEAGGRGEASKPPKNIDSPSRSHALRAPRSP